jgi:hypothetical protein
MRTPAGGLLCCCDCLIFSATAQNYWNAFTKATTQMCQSDSVALQDKRPTISLG